MKALLKRLLWATRLLHIQRRIRNRRTLTVVMFHRVLPEGGEEWRHAEREYVVSTDEFSFCLQFFRRYYSVVSLEQVRAAAAGIAPLPDQALLVTFDDGWKDNVEHAQPLLAQYEIPATLFVNVDAVRQPDLRWWQDALVEVAHAAPQHLRKVHESGDFYAASGALLARALPERSAALAAWTTYSPTNRQMLDEREVAALDRRVWDIGSHGLTHVPFTHAPSLEAEIEESARKLEQWCGKGIDALAFPHGRYTDVIAGLAKSVYCLIFSSKAELNDSDALPFVIGRVHIPSCALHNSAGNFSSLALALFLWRRNITTA